MYSDPLALEQEIVNRLKPLEDGSLRVIPTPEDAEELRNPKTSRVLIAFRGETFQAPQTTNPYSTLHQPCTIRFTLILQIRDLRSHTGALPLTGQIRQLLTGFIPDSTGKPIYQTSTEFIDHQNNLWTYAMDFECPSVYSQPANRHATGPTVLR